MKLIIATSLALSLTGLLPFSAVSDDDVLSAEDKAVIAAELPSYPLTTCVVSKRALDSGDGPFDLVVNGHLFRICCPGCKETTRAKAKEIRKSIERAVISKERAHWPVKKCPVSGEAYDETKAKPVELVHGTRYVKLCCESCVMAFEYDPAVFMAEIDAAYIANQQKDYPLKTCPISGKPLGEEPVDLLYGTTLVRLCCKGCKGAFEKKPGVVIEKVQKAWAKAHAAKLKSEAEKK